MDIDLLGRGHPAYPVQQPSSVRLTSSELIFTGPVAAFGRAGDTQIKVALREISQLKTEVGKLPQKKSEQEAGRPPVQVVCVWIGSPDTGTLAACWYMRQPAREPTVAQGLERAIRNAVGSSGAPGLYMDA
jgi:hypothetical protein